MNPPKEQPKTIIAFKADESFTAALDRVVKATDTDRSKWIRKAIREALRRAESN